MSIHNLVEVPEREVSDANHTRDRFGKKHPLPEGGPRRPSARKLTVLLLVPAVASSFLVSAKASEVSGRGTNIQVTSSDSGVVSLDDRLPPAPPREDRPILYRDESTSIGFNDDGDPNLSTRF
jgi:hypothetical protein